MEKVYGRNQSTWKCLSALAQTIKEHSKGTRDSSKPKPESIAVKEHHRLVDGTDCSFRGEAY